LLEPSLDSYVEKVKSNWYHLKC